ncbi:VWA domain-containing protein [Calothrix sp. CCY 0018]|uniref:VWA domain-containing protein n=1 Tax=Calothrix sp. CCY 0018 TaxID=3103864 RepID=UPI0039C72149
MLEDRDYTIIIDKSGSMSAKDQQGGKSRWEMMQESTLALARKCEQFDPDGITVYTFSNRFKRYDNVTTTKIAQIFKESEPIGNTRLAEVLQDALNIYFQRKASGKTKQNGETILVVTDGEADDRKAVMKVIIEASWQMERDEELAISFIQIGNDLEATGFLKRLDDELKSKDKSDGGAKFDIVDTITIDDIENEQLTLKEVLLNAIID